MSHISHLKVYIFRAEKNKHLVMHKYTDQTGSERASNYVCFGIPIDAFRYSKYTYFTAGFVISEEYEKQLIKLIHV